MYFTADQLQQFCCDRFLPVVHFNARSLKKNFDSIHAFLSSYRLNFSFICVTETWLSPHDKNMFCFPSYVPEYCHRVSGSFGGAAIFVSASIPYQRRYDLSLSVENTESVWIEIANPSLPSSGNKTIIGCIYRSPSSSVPDFCSSLSSIFNKLSLEKKNVVILGDININLLDVSSSAYSDYTACFLGFGYESLISVPTRCVLGASSSLIDHILSNFIPSNDCGVLEASLTDHYPVFCRFECAIPKQLSSFQKNIFDKTNFVKRVEAIEWSFLELLSDPEAAFNSFSSAIKKCLDDSTSFVKCRKNFPAPHNPWLTAGLMKSLRKKDNLYKKLKKRPFNTALRLRYKKYCNILNKVLEEAKRNYYTNRIHNAGNNSKDQWKTINSFLNRSLSEPAIIELQSTEGVLRNADDIANALNKYFCANTSLLPQDYPPTIRECLQSFYLFPTGPDEVVEIINHMKITSAGLDNVQPIHLKCISHVISTPLAYVINLMFKTGIFPSQLKKAKIIPVFKKGDRTSIVSYRPIAILSSYSKIIEKCIEKRLSKYLTKFRILSTQQFGFRAGYSTDFALLSFTDYIKHTLDSGCFAGALLIDLSKAFDSLVHNILLAKLNSIGVVGIAQELINSYLSNRQQAVCVSNVLSTFKSIDKGVPQGSILGPLLFLIYINDLTSILTHSQPFLYADDTTIVTKDKSIDALTNKLSADFYNVQNWCTANGLTINTNKTQFIVFHSSHNALSPTPAITINDHSLLSATKCSFLGVVLDAHLKYPHHISLIRQRIAHGIRTLIEARRFFSWQTLLKLYYAFIHSHITYYITSWANTYPSHILPLQRLQNQAIRILTFSSPITCASPLFQQHSVLTVCNLFKYKLGILVFKCLNGTITANVLEKFQLLNYNPTRFASKHNFLLPHARTNYGKHTTIFAAIQFWNSIPLCTKQLSLPAFKKELKHIISQS